MRQEYLRAAAEAFANITEHQSNCYHYANDHHEPLAIKLAAYYQALLTARIKCKYINAVVGTAIAELSYPTHDITKYAWSGNQRAAFTGIDKAVWSRNGLTKQVNFIIDDIRANAHAVSVAIDSQI